MIVRPPFCPVVLLAAVAACRRTPQPVLPLQPDRVEWVQSPVYSPGGHDGLLVAYRVDRPRGDAPRLHAQVEREVGGGAAPGLGPSVRQARRASASTPTDPGLVVLRPCYTDAPCRPPRNEGDAETLQAGDLVLARDPGGRWAVLR